MKAIPRNQLMIMIQNTWEADKSVFKDQIEKMFDQFGDEWFFEGNDIEKVIDRGLYRAKEFNV